MRSERSLGSDGLDTCTERIMENCQDIMSTVANGKRGRGRPRTRWKDNIIRDMQELNLTVEDAEEREQWRQRIQATSPDQSG